MAARDPRLVANARQAVKLLRWVAAEIEAGRATGEVAVHHHVVTAGVTISANVTTERVPK
jgi:hypothetical protein